MIIWETSHGRISLNSVLLQLLVNFASGFKLELMYISFTVNISRNHFFYLYQLNKSSESKAKFRQDSNCWKRVIEAAKLAYANKTKESITSQKLGFWNLPKVFSIKVNLLHPPIQWKCCLLYLIKQNCLLKLF